MITDDKLTQLLRDVRDSADGLDPARVAAGAARRRSRGRIAAAAGATSAVAVVALGATVLAGGGRASLEPGVAAWPRDALPTAAAQPSTEPTSPATGPRIQWTGRLGARPQGTVPAAGKILIAPQYWFETRGTRWRITAQKRGATELYEPFGWRGTVGNSNVGDGTSPGVQIAADGTGRSVASSVFKGDVRRVIYTEGTRAYEAQVYRLTGIPGWVLSTAVLGPASSQPKPGRSVAAFAYDASGKLIASFPHPNGPHPLAR